MSTKTNTLLIDCGNTYLKWCLFDGDNLTEQQSLHHKDASGLEIYKDLIDSQTGTCNSVVLVSVLGDVFLAGARRIAEDAGMSIINAHSQAKLATIQNGYDEPEKLGSDRLVAMIGGFELIDDQQACIVIDSGTATTIDAVDAKGQHLGGVIFPGLELSLNSLSNNTELLPKLDLSEQQFEPNGLAINTTQAIASGCLLSLASTIDGICNKMQRQLETSSLQGAGNNKVEVRRLLCGGGAKILLPYLENDYDYHENLIMLGLKKIQVNEMEVTSNND
ncbi:MAG: type III pantothenate kinase [Cocleimonas sp.]|jgi:type III pantothenate kinase